jgi:RNA-directed DNA polymerase
MMLNWPDVLNLHDLLTIQLSFHCISRDKTRVINLGEGQASPDFLGYTFRWNRGRYGRNSRYLHVGPSKKALQRERDKLTEMTDSHQRRQPIPALIEL